MVNIGSVMGHLQGSSPLCTSKYSYASLFDLSASDSSSIFDIRVALTAGR